MRQLEPEYLSAKEALPRIRTALTEGKPVHLVVTGSSMLPLLRNRKDAVIVVPCDSVPRVGDVLLYLRPSAGLVIHRVHKILPDGTLLMCGDAQTRPEPITGEQILGTVSGIERNGRPISCRSLRWRLPSRLWQILYPIRPHVLAMLLWLHRIVKRLHTSEKTA